MKDYLLNLTLAALVMALALGYYFGHDFISRLMMDPPSALVQLMSR